MASADGGCVIEVRLDNSGGRLVGMLDVKPTGGSDVYKTFSCPIEGAEGVHDLVFRFKGNGRKDLMNWDYWKFTE